MSIASGRCAYMNCRLARRDYPALHFYRFPTKQTEKCRKWVLHSGNEHLLNMPADKLDRKMLCELHFLETSFVNQSHHRLVHDATPIPFGTILTHSTPGNFCTVMIPTPDNLEFDAPSTSTQIYDEKELVVQRPQPKQYRGKRKPELFSSSTDESDNDSKKLCVADTMPEDWGRPATLLLIELYKENSILYDYKHPSYHNQTYRKEALDRIAGEIVNLGLRPGTNSDDVKARLANMRTQFAAAQHKIAICEKTDHPNGEAYKPTLWWYDHMMFLQDYIGPRNPSINNESLSTSSSSVQIKQEVFEIDENDIKCEVMPSNAHNESHDSNESRTIQPRLERNAEQAFGEFVSSAMMQIADLQTRSKLKVQIMKAICDAQAEDDQNFGHYVSSALLDIHSTSVKASAKSQIAQILVAGQCEDIRH